MNKPLHYILDGNHIPIPTWDVMEWVLWYNDADIRVAYDEFKEINISLSTVFLGIDHNFNPLGDDPVLFETIALGPEGQDLKMYRYRTWGEAKEGHALAKAEIEKRLAKNHSLTIDTIRRITQKEGGK